MITSQLKMCSRATGTIVDIQYGDEGEVYPIVEFRTDDNARARVTNDALALRNAPIGRLVRVCYAPRDNRHARIATFFGSWSGPLFLLFVGGFPFVVGLVGMSGFVE